MKHCLRKLIIFSAMFLFLYAGNIYAESYRLCTGKEFNTRVKALISGNDYNAKSNYSITIFERGFNPPDDRAFYVDISEDKDKSVIAYIVDNVLYWYSDNEVTMNPDCSFMFEKFYRLRRIDLREFNFIDGLNDTRYMFSNCYYLNTLEWRKPNAKRIFEPVEIQGMFFNCQSIKSIDLSRFDTHRVYNMDEVFYKCYNVRNIYVDKTKWTMENVNTFTRTFSQCHCLKTNFGKKASDISSDDYDKYCVAGEEKKEGLLKDINTTYTEYGESLKDVPIDGLNYIQTVPETTITYKEEAEGDGGTGTGTGTGTGEGQAYLGDKSTGYYSDKEQQTAAGVVTPTTGASPIHSSTEVSESSLSSKIDAESKVGESIKQNVVPESTKAPETTKAVESNVSPQTTIEPTADTNTISEEKNPKIMELDDYLKEQGLEGAQGQNAGDSGKIKDNTDFYLFAFIISLLAILLLVGVIVFLLKDKKEEKDQNSSKI